MKIFVKPVDGRRVLDPDTKQPLPPEGASVEQSSHWLRRIRAGEVALSRPGKRKEG
ncbi:MAG: DUF2635 domain-containing protein [Desulfovibrionaceae bacterium]